MAEDNLLAVCTYIPRVMPLFCPPIGGLTALAGIPQVCLRQKGLRGACGVERNELCFFTYLTVGGWVSAVVGGICETV